MGLTGEGLATYAKGKIGVPYFYGCKNVILTEALMAQMHKLYPSTVTSSYMSKARNKGMVGKICTDCSGLIYGYRKKNVGSSQLYQTASKRIPIAQISTMPVGTVLWKSGHVGVYIGNGYCIEAKGIDYGVIQSKVSATAWKYGLLFTDMTYADTTVTSTKKTNPYTEPTATVKKGMTGNSVKWVQYELVEAGFNITIDGDFGQNTFNAVKAFQQSCKIESDGIVGPTTRKYLKAN